MEWEKRGTEQTLSEVMQRLSGLSERELTMPEEVHTDVEVDLQKAAALIRKHIEAKNKVFIVGDYDADGITGSAILEIALSHLGADVIVRLPRRESEGYGLKEVQLAEMPEGCLLITVDNGIAAVEPIRKAMESGHDVVVIDHHLPAETLPEPTIMVNPWLCKQPFSYCGAGLAYKLVSMLTDNEDILSKTIVLAAVGTVADVMPLVGDNRFIVKQGLRNINAEKAPIGLLAIIEATRLGNVDETSIGYKIGPVLNAAGRMADDGAMMSYACLIETDKTNAKVMAAELIKINDERKTAVNTALLAAKEQISDKDLAEKIIVLVLDAAEGILGVVAGRLVEEYQKAVICLAKSKKEGILKGSGRSYGTLNLKDALDECGEYLLGYGGHAGAAGMSVHSDNFEMFKSAICVCKAVRESVMEHTDTVYYDLEVSEQDIPKMVNEVQRYAPFGEGCPQPVFMVKGVQCIAQGSATYQIVATSHIKMFTKNFIVMGFDLAQQFLDMGKPVRVSVVGKLSVNSFAGRDGIIKNTQLEAIDIKPSETVRNMSPLAAALAARLKAK